MPFEQNSNIPQRVREQVNFLRSLARSRSDRKRKRLLKEASPEQIALLAEIALNIVRSAFKLTTRQRKRLIPHADFVRRLSRLRTQQGARKLLVQKGAGAFGLLPALLTPIIIEIGKSLLEKHNQSKTEEVKSPEKDGK